MSEAPCLAKIRGLPHLPHITEINVRGGPSTNYEIVRKGQVGMDNLNILDVQPDSEGKSLDGKIYQWFKLAFPDATEGWIRDDLLAIDGECGKWGYGTLAPDTFAFPLKRTIETSPPTQTQSPPAEEGSEAGGDEATHPETNPVTTTVVEDDAPMNVNRVQKAAVNITAAFEGSGYAAYNNYDAGIISYGIIQYTLKSGNLGYIVDQYLARSNSQTASQLRNYQGRIQAQDHTLKHDDELERLLKEAANDPVMQQIQDERAITNYWDRTIDNYVTPRGYQYPLTYALLFDVSVNFGVGDAFVRMAERDFGIPSGSRPENSGVSEKQIVGRIVELRKRSHDRQAREQGLHGLSARGDFWVDLVRKQDWYLQGDAMGFVYPLGKRAQVANP